MYLSQPNIACAYLQCLPDELIAAFGCCVQQGLTALHKAVQKKSLQVAELLLQSEAQVNFKDKVSSLTKLRCQRFVPFDCVLQHGFTALHRAAEKLSPELVEMLLNKGAAMDAEDNVNASDSTCEMLEPECVYLDVQDGNTPLDLAGQRGKRGLAMVALLQAAS